MPTNPAAISQVGTPPSYPTRPGTTDKAQFLADTATADARFPVYNTELNTATTELNAAATVTYNNAVEAAASAVTASAAAASAESVSNYRGAWASLAGALNLPASVSHSGKTWRLENNLADVTLSEPGVSGDWTDITISSVVINDAGISTSEVWSSSKTSTELGLKQTILQSSYDQIADASIGTGTHTIDYSLGDYQQITVTGNIALATSNFIAGRVCTCIFELINGGDHIITPPVGWQYAGKAFPQLTSGGKDTLMLIKDKDEVFTLYVVGKDVGVV